MLQKLKENVIECKIEKKLFGQNETEYLGLWVTRELIVPINKKVETILNTIPQNKNDR